ncbi:hypothetical protein D3C87_637340 [compost metagenome]
MSVDEAEARLNKLGKHNREPVVKQIQKNQKRLKVRNSPRARVAQRFRARARQARRAESKSYRKGEIAAMIAVYRGETHIPVITSKSDKARRQFHRGIQRSIDNFIG